MIGSGFIVLYNAYRAKIVEDKLRVENRHGLDKPLIFSSEDDREEKQIVKSC